MKHDPLNNALSVDWVQNTEAFAVEPDVYFDDPEPEQFSGDIGFVQVLQWIRNGISPISKEIRLQAVFYHFAGGSKFAKSQAELGREIGVKKQTINQQVIELKTYFAKLLGRSDTIERASAACGMRNKEARENMAQKCKSNHQKRKALSASNESLRTSEPCTWTPPTMQELQSQQRERRLSQHGNVANCSIEPKESLSTVIGKSGALITFQA